MSRRSMHTLSLGCALGALLVAGCGGPNESEHDRRRSTPQAAPTNLEEITPPPVDDEEVLPEVDAGAEEPAPDASLPDAAPVVPAGSFAVGTELETTADLNLREGPGVQFAIIVEIPLGTRVKVVKISGADGWVNVSYNASIGYSSKDFLKAVP